MKKFRIIKECRRDTPSPSNCQKKLLKTLRMENLISGQHKMERALQKQQGTMWHLAQNNETPQRLQRLANQRQFLYPYYCMLFFRTYSKMVSLKHSGSLFFLLVTNSTFSARVHYISTMVQCYIKWYNMSWIPSNHLYTTSLTDKNQFTSTTSKIPRLHAIKTQQKLKSSLH